MKTILLIASLIMATTVTQAQSRPVAAIGVPSPVVSLFPNPATSVINFTIQKEFEKGYSLQIFNAILGRKMYEQTNIPERMSVNLAEFSRGIYIYQLRDKAGRMVVSGKFQVAK